MGGGKCATCAAHSVRPHTPPRALGARPSPCRGGCEETRSRSRARTPPASDVKQRILFASPRLRRSASLPIQSRPLRAVAEQLFAARFRQERKEAERRQTHTAMPARIRRAGRATERRLAPPFRFGRARLPAFHHGTCGGDRTPPLSSSSRTSWDGTTEERVLSAPCRPSAAGVMSPQAGHRAGRAFWPGAARERG